MVGFEAAGQASTFWHPRFISVHLKNLLVLVVGKKTSVTINV